MGCCGKTIRTGKQIAKGYMALIIGKAYAFTDGRIRKCEKCIYNYWLSGTLWCSLCKCYIPAASRTKDKHCPKGYWKLKELPKEAIRKEL